MKYRKKPVVIEAMQYDGDNINEVAAFVGDELAGQYAVTVAAITKYTAATTHDSGSRRNRE